MLDFNIVGPIVTILIVVDVGLHLYLDYRKRKASGRSRFLEPTHNIPSYAMAAVMVSTLIAFVLVFTIPIAWILGGELILIQALLPLIDSPPILWVPGFVLLVAGILIHGWSRYVRKEMAASWEMRESHILITSGPYSRVRHPSYTSYFTCFLGLVLMLPSVVSLILLVGVPGYYVVSKTEEDLLLARFGNEYQEYMFRTRRFVPVTFRD
ncbi:MAG: methyltransferase family protein [Candidatus Thorarchaeota archaeon]|jgi:protein-S-isoprenylcysteine O-methyltransferase Ste14